jgi:MFS superfamily sulfate permease-like transporter
MLAAIGLILIMKQLPHFFGYDKDYEGDQSFAQSDNENTFSELFKLFNVITPAAAIIGLVSMFILILWETKAFKAKKALTLVPGPLVVVLVAVVLNILFKTYSPGFELENKHLVTLPIADTPAMFVSFFTFPDFSFIKNPQVWISGLTIAIVASLETLLGIEAVDKLDPYKRVTPTNRELKAQGVGNMVSGLIGGLPLTSVIVRSSANVMAGAKTKMSTIFHGSLLLLSVFFIPKVMNLIPLSALAAILIFTGYKLAKVGLFKEFYVRGWDQFIPFVVTIVAILLSDLLIGIVIGVLVGLFFMVRSNFRSSVFVVNDENRYLVRLRKDVSFLNKPIVKQKLEEVPANSFIIIDATRADFIDKDIIEEINNFLKHAHLKNIKVEIKKSMYKSMHTLFNEQPKLLVR